MVWGTISYHGQSNLLRSGSVCPFWTLRHKKQPTNQPICYEFRVISIATCISVKCYWRKSFPWFKVPLELSFNRIMQALTWQKLFETSVQPNTSKFFLILLVRRISRLLSTYGIWLVSVFVICVLQLQKTNFAALLISSIVQTLILDTFCSFENFVICTNESFVH